MFFFLFWFADYWIYCSKFHNTNIRTFYRAFETQITTQSERSVNKRELMRFKIFNHYSICFIFIFISFILILVYTIFQIFFSSMPFMKIFWRGREVNCNLSYDYNNPYHLSWTCNFPLPLPLPFSLHLFLFTSSFSLPESPSSIDLFNFGDFNKFS